MDHTRIGSDDKFIHARRIYSKNTYTIIIMSKFKTVISTMLGVILLTILVLPVFVNADTATKDSAGCVNTGGKVVCSLDNPLVGSPDEKSIIGTALKGAIGLVGAITLVMFVYGGFTWMISGGSPEKIKSGRDTLIWASIGLIAVFAAYGTLNWIFAELFSGK